MEGLDYCHRKGVVIHGVKLKNLLLQVGRAGWEGTRPRVGVGGCVVALLQVGGGQGRVGDQQASTWGPGWRHRHLWPPPCGGSCE